MAADQNVSGCPPRLLTPAYGRYNGRSATALRDAADPVDALVTNNKVELMS